MIFLNYSQPQHCKIQKALVFPALVESQKVKLKLGRLFKKINVLLIVIKVSPTLQGFRTFSL